jgi:predicted house-cleaning noncanonical NTP pyrophosphatase (MazG superfamily)
MPVYRKLVRDFIPAIIAETGKTYQTRRLSEEEYKMALQQKLQEEMKEYIRVPHDEQAKGLFFRFVVSKGSSDQGYRFPPK